MVPSRSGLVTGFANAITEWHIPILTGNAVHAHVRQQGSQWQGRVQAEAEPHCCLRQPYLHHARSALCTHCTNLPLPFSRRHGPCLAQGWMHTVRGANLVALVRQQRVGQAQLALEVGVRLRVVAADADDLRARVLEGLLAGCGASQGSALRLFACEQQLRPRDIHCNSRSSAACTASHLSCSRAWQKGSKYS